jgi:DNA-directed RNA polymerase subunit RPC12/RpoP
VTTVTDAENYFLSHTGSDKALVREVAARIHYAGRQTFFDEWSIGVGESIPGAISSALADYEALVLFWSDAASKSLWVRREFRGALTKFIEESRGLVVVKLDGAEVPDIIADLKYIDATSDPDPNYIADQLMGFRGNERLIAMQRALEEMDLGIRYFEGYGPVVACLRCGNPAKNLDQWSQTDYERDDVYAGVRCPECKWEAGGEI